MAFCWAAGLPKDILMLILERLFLMSDYVRFSAVCKTWHSTALDQKHSRLTSCNEQLPMLMTPTKGDRGEDKRRLYIINQQGEDKFSNVKLRVPPLNNKRCCGSSYGWLAFVGKNLCVILINPFTGNAIRLPPVCNLLPNDDENKREVIVKKVIFSGNPSIYPDDDFLVVAVYGGLNSLAFFRTGGVKGWKYLKKFLANDLDNFIVSDVIFYNGMVYAVDHKCRVISINIVYDTVEGPWKFKLNSIIQRFAEARPRRNPSSVKSYIVESSGGGGGGGDHLLLLVQRCLAETDDRRIRGVTVSFKVFKMVSSDGEKENGQSVWVEIKCLAGGDALFLGENHSMCVSALRFPGCQPNSIYYTADAVDCATYHPHWPCDMGIFNMEDGSIGTHYVLDPSQKHRAPSVWVWAVPSLNCINTLTSQSSLHSN